MFFFGMEEFTDCFIGMWKRMSVSNDKVACLWPNDVDANAFRRGFPPAMKKAAYTPVAPIGYEDGTADFSARSARSRTPPREDPAVPLGGDLVPTYGGATRSSSTARTSPRSTPRAGAGLASGGRTRFRARSPG